MKTKLIKVSEENFSEKILECSEALRQGELVAFPTETVYGLGANGLSTAAVQKIYVAKGRPNDNPLILHVSGIEMVKPLVRTISKLEKRLIAHFWPGPLTLILPAAELVPRAVTGGLDTIAVRCPNHSLAQALITTANIPIAAPSANISGRPSPTTANAVADAMDGRIYAILDGGPCEIGLESTVVACTDDKITIYRPGAVTEEMLQPFASEVEIDAAIITGKDIPKAPGLKYRHYAPMAPLTVFMGSTLAVQNAILEYGGAQTGYFVSAETADILPSKEFVYIWGRQKDFASFAAKLYEGLLYFDSHGVKEIVAEGIVESGLGKAIMNRLLKAADYKVRYVE